MHLKVHYDLGMFKLINFNLLYITLYKTIQLYCKRM